ncbi:hypothetical protein [Leuconostoc lactis]|uniref:hypothetical protein n=1 Tax=Leuconostoc lactis TaxID=1246 RepID=UPI00101FE4B4|nr:hypothetical protein [Leuconostoc lactis]MSB66616.1 hypothetical protein [Leuconostoc lactis]RYS88526.1 hypothetical protein EAI73_03680 [Leuconostoc lactis]
MNVNYDLMLANAKGDLAKAEIELKLFKTNTNLSIDGKLRKDTIRDMTNWTRTLKRRVESLEKEMRA